MAGKLKKLTEYQASQSVHYYEAGLSLGRIAEMFNVTRQSMWDLLRRRCKLRAQKRYGKKNNFFRGTKDDDWAQNKVERAIKLGLLKRPSECSECGKQNKFKNGRSGILAHHSDYNKPLQVKWLCQPCHFQWHKNNKAIIRPPCGSS